MSVLRRHHQSPSPLSSSKNRIELKSLEDIWLGLFLTILQIMCINRACHHFRTFKTATWEPFTRPSLELSLYLGFICLAIILLPVFAFTSIFKINSYANDNLQLGKDTEPRVNNMPKKQRTHANRSSQNTRYSLMPGITSSQTNIKSSQPFSTSSIISNSYSEATTATVPDSRTAFNNQFLSKIKTMFSLKHTWKNLPPVSSLAHLTISFILLVPEVLLIAKEIQYALRPKGFVHHSQMDFIFKRPLDRFSESQTFLDPSPFYFDTVNQQQQPNLPAQTNQVNYYMSKSQIKIQLISSSLDDTDQVNYTPHVSLDFFSYLLALVLMVLRYSRPLWTLNKAYAFLFSVHLIFAASLSAISFSAFEILYKFQSCFASGIKLKLTSQQEQLQNATSTRLNATEASSAHPFSQVVFNLPFATSPNLLLLTYMSSMILLATSAVPIYAFALYLYRLKLNKLQTQLKRHIASSNNSKKHPQQCYYEETRNLYSTGSTTGESTDQGVYLQDSPSPAEPLLDSNKKTEVSETGQFPNFNHSSNPPPLPSEPPPNPTKVLSESDLTTSSSSSSSSSTISLEHSTISQQTTANIINAETPTNVIVSARTKMPFFVVYAPYKPHIFALIILLALCIHTAVLVYDLICLYQLTSDTVPFWAALAHIGFILWYIFVWLLLTFKTSWPVEFAPAFKLAVWSEVTSRSAPRVNEPSICSSSTDSFKRRLKQSSNRRQLSMAGSYHAEYNRSAYASQRRLLKPSSLSMSNLAHATSQNSVGMMMMQQQQRKSVNESGEGSGSRSNVFSSSGLLVSDAVMGSNYVASTCGEYDADMAPYENFNTSKLLIHVYNALGLFVVLIPPTDFNLK